MQWSPFVVVQYLCQLRKSESRPTRHLRKFSAVFKSISDVFGLLILGALSFKVVDENRCCTLFNGQPPRKSPLKVNLNTFLLFLGNNYQTSLFYYSN